MTRVGHAETSIAAKCFVLSDKALVELDTTFLLAEQFIDVTFSRVLVPPCSTFLHSLCCVCATASWK